MVAILNRRGTTFKLRLRRPNLRLALFRSNCIPDRAQSGYIATGGMTSVPRQQEIAGCAYARMDGKEKDVSRLDVH